jgi:hypothetical protein
MAVNGAETWKLGQVGTKDLNSLEKAAVDPLDRSCKKCIKMSQGRKEYPTFNEIKES